MEPRPPFGLLDSQEPPRTPRNPHHNPCYSPTSINPFPIHGFSPNAMAQFYSQSLVYGQPSFDESNGAYSFQQNLFQDSSRIPLPASMVYPGYYNFLNPAMTPAHFSFLPPRAPLCEAMVPLVSVPQSNNQTGTSTSFLTQDSNSLNPVSLERFKLSPGTLSVPRVHILDIQRIVLMK